MPETGDGSETPEETLRRLASAADARVTEATDSAPGERSVGRPRSARATPAPVNQWLPPSEWLEDVAGPDGVRVTRCVEPAVKRWVRERDAWTVGRYSSLAQAVRDAIPLIAQRVVFRDAWAVLVEADSGTRVRLTRPSRDAAMTLAKSVGNAVRSDGVAALDHLA